MSLTSHLERRHRPLREYFEQRLPNLKGVQQRCRNAGPVLHHPVGDSPAFTRIGTAFDYRLRYYFACTPPDQFVARHGAARLGDCDDQYGNGGVWSAFAAELERLAIRVNPIGRALESEMEIQLNRFCYVLALYEECYRTLDIENSPLLPLENATVEELLDLVPEGALQDLSQLSAAFFETQSRLLAGRAVLNPTFTGSLAVGGADADLIVDGCLIDIKTSIQDRLRRREDAYQLVGYPLLDWDDEYGITDVTFYFSRRAALVSWPLNELLTEMAGEPVDAATLRIEVREVLAQIPKARRQPLS